MWIIVLEILLVLGIAIGIIVWTIPKRDRAKPPAAPQDTETPKD